MAHPLLSGAGATRPRPLTENRFATRNSAQPQGPAPANAPSWPSWSTAHSKRPRLPFRSLPHLRVQRAWGPSTPHPHAKRGSDYSHTALRSPAPGAKASECWVRSEGHPVALPGPQPAEGELASCVLAELHPGPWLRPPSVYPTDLLPPHPVQHLLSLLRGPVTFPQSLLQSHCSSINTPFQNPHVRPDPRGWE